MWTMRLRRLLEIVRWSEIGVGFNACAACDFPWLLRLARSESGVRCPRCAASAVTQSLVAVLRERVPDLAVVDAYELSARGPLVRFLRRRCRSLSTSELIDDVPLGESRDGVLCQNVEKLTFADNCFDLCTSSEVFEHVEDDHAGFSEIYRVLRPGGSFVFTVPLHDTSTTVERMGLRDGRRVHLLPAAYHADRYRGAVVLVQRDYGRDLLDRLDAAGFTGAELVRPRPALLGHARSVVVCRKPAGTTRG